MLQILNSRKQAIGFGGVLGRMLLSGCDWMQWICDVNRF